MRHTGSLCGYGDLSDERCREKLIFGLNDDNIRTELLKTHIKPDNFKNSLSDVVAEARAIELRRWESIEGNLVLTTGLKT